MDLLNAHRALRFIFLRKNDIVFEEKYEQNVWIEWNISSSNSFLSLAIMIVR